MPDCTSKEISIQSTIVPVRKSLVQWLTESRFGISKFGIPIEIHMSPRVKIPYPPCQLENMKARALLAVVAAALLAQACADPRIPNCKHLNTKCCSKCYVGEENKPCDTNHFCLSKYQDPKGSEPMTLITRALTRVLSTDASVRVLSTDASAESSKPMTLMTRVAVAFLGIAILGLAAISSIMLGLTHGLL